jgi:hypothetical protein
VHAEKSKGGELEETAEAGSSVGGGAVDPEIHIPGYGSLALPTLSALGGEASVLATPPEPQSCHDLFTSVVALCTSWPQVRDRQAATSWVHDAVVGLDDSELLDFNDIILASREALPDLAETLADAWQTISEDSGTIRGNIALEGWTRLALGGWTAALALRGALFNRARRAASGRGEPDIFLVRAIGAALDQWADQDLQQALERLASFEDIECDVAFELGMAALRKAVEATVIGEAADALGAARGQFEHACLEGGRPDAVAFATACTAVAGFLNGFPVSEESVSVINSSAHEWLLGYLGQTPHWRQPRAETGGAWAALVRDLHAIRDLDDPAWFRPEKLLADVGHLYSAHSSSTLLANPCTLPIGHSDPLDSAAEAASNASKVATIPIPVALGPRLDAALGARAERLYLVDRWLDTMAEQLADASNEPGTVTPAMAAVHRARERIRQGTVPPGKTAASREDGIAPDLREALRAAVDQETYDAIVDVAQTIAAGGVPAPFSRIGVQRVTPLAEQLLLTRLKRELAGLLPAEFKLWALHITELLTVLIRIVNFTIDRSQGGQRSFPWHKAEVADKKPHEYTLADYLRDSIHFATGYPAYVEVPDVGGGRADVLVHVGSEVFVIEVKRIDAARTDDQLADKYGDQAGQYTLTGPPFAFLAVLDLRHREVRIDADSSFWVRPWRVAESGKSRALTAFRVLSDVDSPSASST